MSFINAIIQNPDLNVISIIIITMIAVAVILIFVVRSITPVTPFLYANARIHARSNQLISSRKVEEFTDLKNLQELENSLRDTDYIEELEKLPKKDLKYFHKAIEKSFLNSILELKELSPKQAKPLFDAYLMFLEATVLKTIYRIKFYKNKVDEHLIFEVGNINSILLKHLIEAESIADVNTVMSSTIYQEVFSKKYDSIEEFDVAVEEFVLNNFINVAKKTKMYESKLIIDIVNKKIDILNILALIKFRIRNIPKEKQIEYLIKNKTLLNERFKDLIYAETFNDFVNTAKGLPYYDALNKALNLYEKDNLLVHFEYELFKFYKEFVISQDIGHTLGPYPLFSFLIKKEIEKRNLFVLSRGIDAKFLPEKIKEMIVWLY